MIAGRRLKPRPLLHKEIAEIISEQIISGKYPANTFLPPEPVLCKQMGVSRTVVREAIKHLESGGFVHISRGIGTKVLEARQESISRPLKIFLRRKSNSLQDLLELRKILEVAIAALAAERRTPENLRLMERAIQVMSERPDQPAGYVDADLDFHVEIARATQNPTFSIILDPLRDLLRESRAASFSGPRMAETRMRQHKKILETIRKRDVAGARQAMSQHLTSTQRDLARWLNSNNRKS